MRLLIMGPPGAGKGTQAVLIKDKYHIPHISTGAMFRDAIISNTSLGIEAKKYIDKGELVPDQVTIGIVYDRLRLPDCNNGFLLDGFPRTLVQAETLDKILSELNIKLDIVLNIESEDEVLIKRIAGRRVCPKCKASYHVESIKPKVEGICDVCGTKLIQRKDDNRKTILNRLEVYENQTKPLLAYYNAQGLVKCVDGNGGIKSIFEKVEIILGGMNDNFKK
jgi:adenylate kinase